MADDDLAGTATMTAPPYRVHGADMICETPSGEGRVTIRDITPAEFEPAYALAFSSLAFFDPTAVSAATGGRATVTDALSAKQLMAARLVADFPEPRQGRMVANPGLAPELADDAYAFARRFDPADNPSIAAAVMAAMLGVDRITAERLAEGRRQMSER